MTPPEAGVPPAQMVALDDALREVVRTLLDGGYDPLAVSTMVVRHVAHRLGEYGQETDAAKRGQGTPL